VNTGSVHLTDNDEDKYKSGIYLNSSVSNYLKNSGVINLTEPTYYGVRVSGASGTITNTGTIQGIRLGAGGSVVNGQAGAGGGEVSGPLGIEIFSNTGTVANYGVASRIWLHDGGSVTNARGGGVTAASDLAAVYITGATGSVENLGTLTDGRSGTYLYLG